MSEDSPVVPAALSVAVAGFRMLADGTIAITVHAEPKDRALAMTFCNPGQPAALAALKAGSSAVSAPAPAAPNGPICREAIELCANPAFHQYVGAVYRDVLESSSDSYRAERCKAFICSQCSVTSRKQLDTAEGARDLFIAHVRVPFQRWVTEKRR